MKAINQIIKTVLLINVLITLFGTSEINSAPLKNVKITINQPDGEIINCLASGDENYNWLHDENGYVIMQNNETGHYVYADKDGVYVHPTSYLVNKIDPSTIGILPNIKDENLLKQIKYLPVENKSKLNENLQNGTNTEFNNIILFIRFADENEFVSDITMYDKLFNDVNKVSLYQYYQQASYNQLQVNSQIIKAGNSNTLISYKAKSPRSYYKKLNTTTNPDGYSNVIQSRSRLNKLLTEVIENAKKQISDSDHLDKNNDGFVDNITFIVSGDPEAWGDLLWPHMSDLSNLQLTLNGKNVRYYNLQLQSMTKVGVLCHEIFHSLGAPDLYHYTDDKISPVGQWDLMEECDYNQPQQMGAYMKFKYGNWIDNIPVINKSNNYSIRRLTDKTNNCMKIDIPNSVNEYYVLEFRSKSTEPSLPGSGLIISRINTEYEGVGNRLGNDEVYIFRPNGTPEANGKIQLANFTDTEMRTNFSGTTNPYPFLSNGVKDNNFRIYNISLNDSIAYFTVEFENDKIVKSVEDENKINTLNDILLYPNPANNIINIKTNDQNINNIEIYNKLGNNLIIYDDNNSGKEVSINIENLPIGCYYSKIKTNDTTQFIKFIKK